MILEARLLVVTPEAGTWVLGRRIALLIDMAMKTLWIGIQTWAVVCWQFKRGSKGCFGIWNMS